ncbi:MAG: SMI1/KNR4 family protein [Pirellulaceae bacterium]|nr:SMI1/KNR4 family protein [Pirellulaceae bacterium]
MRNCSRTNWRELLQRRHTAAYADSGYDPIFGESAGDELIREVQGKIGLEMPIELTDLYRSVDGYGLEMDPESMLSPWLLVPCSMLPDFISQNRDVIAGTHPSLASRFLPLIDLVNGDSIGYVFAQNGLLIDGLHMLMHELYEYEPDQEPDGFCRTFECTLAEYLEP